jgi:serine/threonine protein kinase
MEDLTGKQLGPYQIVAPLGEGGMAAVFRAYQPGMERYVALKVLPRHFAEDPEFSARFQREARILAQLQHPHILPVFDYGQVEGYSFIVMPFVPSGTLTDSMQGQPLPLPRIRQVISQVGDALNYAHDRGLVHRDVKPSNVLIDKSGNCLLTDFGLARMVEASVNLTASGTILGTPAYMSPEQGSGSTIDSRSDIYSLGIILYEMATGRVPYRAETPVAVVFMHVSGPLPLPRSVNPDLPEAVERVILKALARNPDDRYQTAEDLVAALKRAIPETPMVTSKPEPRLTPRPKPIHRVATPTLVEPPAGGAIAPLAPKRRIPVWAWASAVVLLGLMAAGGIFLANRIRTPLESAVALIPPHATASALPSTTATLATASTFTSSPTGTIARDPSTYDDFDNPAFDGKLDPSLWNATVTTPGYSEQRGGILVLSLPPDAGTEKLVPATGKLRSGQSGFVESRIRLSSEYTGQRGDLGLSLMTPAKDGEMLLFSCFIYRGARPHVGCEAWGRGSGAEYSTGRMTTLSDYWHTVRIEMDPEIRVTFYVDGQEEGSYRPPDAEELKGKVFSFRLGISAPDADGITANFDDVRIGNLK